MAQKPREIQSDRIIFNAVPVRGVSTIPDWMADWAEAWAERWDREFTSIGGDRGHVYFKFEPEFEDYEEFEKMCQVEDI